MRKLALLALTILTCASVLGQDAAKSSSAADKLGWQMAIHAYTFRKFSIFECIDKTAALGLKYMSLSGSVSLDGKSSVSTVDLSDKDAEAIKQAAAAKGLKLVNIGVSSCHPTRPRAGRSMSSPRRWALTRWSPSRSPRRLTSSRSSARSTISRWPSTIIPSHHAIGTRIPSWRLSRAAPR